MHVTVLSSCNVTGKKVCLPYEGRVHGGTLIHVTNTGVHSRLPDGTENVPDVVGMRPDQPHAAFYFDFRDRTSADSIPNCPEGIERASRTVVLTRYSTSACTIL